MASMEEVLKSDKLPSLPQVATQILEVANSAEPELLDMADIIQLDPALSAQFLRVVNNVTFGFRGKTTTIKSAVLKLGLNMTQSVALSFYLSSAPSGKKHFDQAIQKYWWRSLTQAVVAQELGKRNEKQKASEYFLGGMLQDIGSLAMLATCFEEYLSVFAASNSARFHDIENEFFGFTHIEVARHLFGKWGLSARMTEPMLEHHLPINPGAIQQYSNERILYRTISLVADNVFQGSHGNSGELANSDSFELGVLLKNHFHYQQDEITEFLSEVAETVREVASGLDVSLGEFPRNEDLLSEANEMLSRLALKSMHTRMKDDSLLKDPLTGVYNRKKLGQLSLDHQSVSVGVLSLDIDNYLQINETYGSEVSDEVIRLLASNLESQIRADDCVIRYGDDEFILILHNVTKIDMDRISERINEYLPKIAEECGFDLEITLSIGGAFEQCQLESQKDILCLGELVQSADLALFQAKRRGGNRLCFAN